MPIVLRHQAAGIAPDQENPRTKYGMAMVLQQQRADQQMRQRTQDQQYDMQRMGAMGAMREMREPSIGEDDAMLEQEIRSGLYDPDTVRALRQDQRAMRQIMRDTNIDGTQRAQALGNLQSRMRMSRSTGKVQPMMQQMGPAALQTKPPMTEAEYFSDEKNYANAYAAAQARLEAAGPDTPVTPENIQAQMHNDYLAKQKFLQGLSQPQPNAPAGPQAPTAPDGGSRGGRGVILEAGTPQASYSGGQPTFGASPVMAQGGMGAPVGPGAYQPTGSYTGGQPVFGASPVLADPAKQQYAEVSGGNRDTQYALQNPQMSAGQAYFDPNNPVRQEMSAADQSMVNPQKQTLGKPGGRYGLGMVDYGINPATGNRVTASIRPGGTMPEYDEPVGKPGTAMGGGRGGLTIMGGRKKPAAAPEVSPGGTPVDAGLTSTASPLISRDDPRVKEAEMIATNPKATEDDQIRASDVLKSAGYTRDEVARMAASSNATQSSQPSQPARKKLRDPIWGPVGDFLVDPLGSANPLGPSKQSPNATPSQSTSAPSGGDWKKYSDSTRRSGETPLASPSLLDQLEQAEPSPATPASASDSTQNQGELRTWTSVDGRTFEGTIVEGSLEAASRQTAGQQMITVKRKDGQVFNIPIERLGEEDRAYLDALYKTRSAVNWTEGKDSRMGKGEAYQQNKPASNSNKKPTSKPKYIGEAPKEVYQRPPSSSRGSAKRTS